MAYTKTVWVNNTTPANQTNMNKIEQGIFDTDAGVTVLDTSMESGWVDFNLTVSGFVNSQPTPQIHVNGDYSGIITAGCRIKITQSGVDKYFIVLSSTFVSTYTVITLYGGTDYTITSLTDITETLVSFAYNPVGFNVDPRKWTITTTDTTLRQQSSPVANTWYNLGGVSITLPVGLWKVKYAVSAQLIRTGTGTIGKVTLSTANNTEVSNEYTSYIGVSYGTSGALGTIQQLEKEFIISRSSSQAYYLNTLIDANGTTVGNNNDKAPLKIEAVCAYL